MNERLLSVTPTRFLCPYCGNWHNWDVLCEERNGSSLCYKTKCDNHTLGGEYILKFDNRYCYYSIEPICEVIPKIKGRIMFSSMIESMLEPVVTLDLLCIAKKDVGCMECSKCSFKENCAYTNCMSSVNRRAIYIPLGLEFDEADYNLYK